MDQQKVCKGGHILEIWRDKRDCYIFRNRSVERGRNERIRKRQTESLRRSSTTCASSRKIPELVSIFQEKKMKSQCELKVKIRRDDKLFKMSAANYIKQFITTFFLYLSLPTPVMNVLRFRYLRIIALLPRRNASALLFVTTCHGDETRNSATIWFHSR